MSAIGVSVCGACGWRGFPARLWCPACGTDDVAVEAVLRGTLEQWTAVEKAPGRDVALPTRVATVALAGGGRAVARHESGTAAVSVDDDGGAPVAREAR